MSITFNTSLTYTIENKDSTAIITKTLSRIAQFNLLKTRTYVTDLFSDHYHTYHEPIKNIVPQLKGVTQPFSIHMSID
jgi:hypothetical protein